MWWIILVSILAFLIILYFAYGFIFLRFMFKRKKKPIKFKDDLSSKIDFSGDEEWINSPKGSDISFTKNKHQVKARYLPKEGSHRYLVFLHGYKGSIYSHSKMVHRLADSLKASSLILVERGDFNSPYSYTSLGEQESEDLLLLLSYILEKDPEAEFYLWGVSMGAATLIFASGSYPQQVKSAIIDSGFSSIKDEIIYLFKGKLGIFASFFYFPVKLAYHLKFGLSITKYDDSVLTKCETPIFFIHGDKDTFVPVPNLAHHLAYRVNKPLDQNWLIKDCPHAIGDFVIPDEYFRKTSSFFLK
jgi:pimeloyl-ACP methyl ester carboxylesterase